MHIISRGLPGAMRRLAFVAAAGLGLLFTAQAHAATGSLYANGITSPGGSVTLGANLWVADHALGFCRTDASAAGAAAPFTVNQGVCNASAVSPGQPSFDSAPGRNFVYVPDNSSKSQGVWRLTFNPATNRVGSPALMAGGVNGLTGNRATATALTADGNTLYVGFIRNGNIIKVTNPGGASQTATTVAHTSDGRGLSAMALVGGDLYLAEGGAVTVVSGVGACTGTCVAEPTGVQSAAPAALAADSAHGLLYVAEGGTVFRYAIATDTQDVLATKSDAGTAFANVTGLSLDSADNLYVGDDPTAGAQILQGHLYKIAAASTTAAEVPGAPGAPGAPPAAPALTTGTLYSNGITSPGGSVTLGTHLWVADHALGFCRTDASAAGAAAPFTLNQGVCNLSAVSPGQPSFDSAPTRNFVYVPDNSSKSRGVWRLTFNPATNRVGSPALMAGGAGVLTGNRATATALSADGNTLYVGFLRNGSIVKVTNPGGASQTSTTIAQTSDGRGISAMALVGGDLYLAEGGAVTAVSGVDACTGGCVAEPTGVQSAAPTALAGDSAHGLLYVAEGGTVFRYTIATDTQDVLATKSDAGTAFANVTGLSLDSADNLYAGDDPTAGAQILQGHIYKVAAASTTPAEVPGAPGAPGAPPPTPALTTGTLYANGITSPGGSVTLGANLWVADHALGFCRTDATAVGAAAPFAINQNVCNLSAVSPGQPSSDSARNFVYVPDNSSKSQGVWRLTFNPTTNTVGSPALMAAGTGGLTGNRATATALTADGSTLYVGFIKNGNIIKVTNPGGASQTATTVAKTSDGRGLSAMALIGSDLYLAEGGAVTVVPNVGACAGACVAEPTASSATSPTALAADPASNTLYVAETPASTSTILRLHVATGVEDVLATGSDTGAAFRNATGLSLDGAGNLYVGDDPTAGAQILQGHIYKVAPTP